jgi:uncharacterized protein YecT (DUF1311 family)
MKYYLLLLLLIVATFAMAQTHNGPTPITPAIEAKINAEIEKEIPAFLVKLEKYNSERTDKFDESTKFGLDTFRIESSYRKTMDYDYSTYGISKATSDAAAKYDALLNKYYKLLAAKLKPADKAALIAAQRSWIAYRDNEVKLYAVLSKGEYSGGGTIQSSIAASRYYAMIKARVSQLFEYYAAMYN